MGRDSAAAGLAMASTGYVLYGLLGPVGKLLLPDFPPMALNAWRAVLGLLVMSVIVGPAAIREGLRLLRDWRLMVLVVIGGGINFTFYFLALERIDATYVALGFYTAPLWTAGVAWFWIKERTGWLFLPTVAVMLAGGYLALGGVSGGVDRLGLALAVFTGLLWAVYAVGLRVHAPGLRLGPLMWASFAAWTIYFIPVMLVVEGVPTLPTGTAPWAWMALYVAGPTVGATLLFNASLQRAPAAAVNLLVGLEVAFTVPFAWLLVGERFTLLQLAGVAVVILAVTAYLWHQGYGARAAKRAAKAQ